MSDRTMPAIRRTRYGEPDEVLKLREVALPEPGDGEVRVRVRASSVNAADLDYCRGWPSIARLGTGVRGPRFKGLGLDVAGVVDAVGAGVSRFREGDEVFADMTQFGYGAFATHVCAAEKAFAPKPAGLTFEEAATVPQAAILAIQGLRGKRKLGAGQRVLVNGASGNVGPWAVQIAKAAGAEVTGVASAAKLEFVGSLGADEVVDYRAEDVTKGRRRFDRIIDVAAHHSIPSYRRILRKGGTYVWVGGSVGTMLQSISLGPLISFVDSRSLGLMIWWRPFRAEDVARLTELLESGQIRARIDRTYPLAEVPAALRYLADGKAFGKLVITMS